MHLDTACISTRVHLDTARISTLREHDTTKQHPQPHAYAAAGPDRRPSIGSCARFQMPGQTTGHVPSARAEPGYETPIMRARASPVPGPHHASLGPELRAGSPPSGLPARQRLRAADSRHETRPPLSQPCPKAASRSARGRPARRPRSGRGRPARRPALETCLRRGGRTCPRAWQRAARAQPVVARLDVNRPTARAQRYCRTARQSRWPGMSASLTSSCATIGLRQRPGCMPAGETSPAPTTPHGARCAIVRRRVGCWW